MNIYDWATKWHISQECFRELLATATYEASTSEAGASESRVQSLVRLEAAQHGVHLFRNNVGGGSIVDTDNLCDTCMQRARPSFIRWGLANDSKRINDAVKSADLIGWRTVSITSAHVGTLMAQFVSREIKSGEWTAGHKMTKREQAQIEWANLVNSNGGDAAIVNGTGSL